MTSNLQRDMCSLIASRAKEFQDFAESFARSRFLLHSTEFGQNNEETEALQNIAAGIKCEIVQSDSGVSLSIDFDDGDTGEYLDVVEHGMPPPLTGGRGGIVTNPDGSTYPSRVPKQLWGNPIDEYAKTGSDVLDEVKMMLKDLFTQRVKEITSECKPELTKLAKSYVTQEILTMFRK